jgi:diguanylate cyclase (GGDEF)-like protein
MRRAATACTLAAALALGAAFAQAQQPPPGGARPPPPPGMPAPAGVPDARFQPPPPPPPPPPPQAQVQFPPPTATTGEPAAAAVAPSPAPVPAPATGPTAVQPFPQLKQPSAPPPLEFGAERDRAAGGVAADVAPTSLKTGAAPENAMPAPLPRWLWLLAAACVLAFAGWRAALRKSRVIADEAERLARDARQLKSAHVQLKSHSEQLRQLATNDPLTGVLNRQGFSAELRQVLEHLARFRRPLNLILFDMDNFKQINDGLGHMVGDQALKLVVGVVREHLASEDLFGRFGGDEFLIACADQPIEDTQALAESIRAGVVRAAAQHDPPMPGLSLSLGIAQANDRHGYQADTLFHRADTALYAAKNAGRNRVVLADDSLEPPPVLAAATRHLG